MSACSAINPPLIPTLEYGICKKQITDHASRPICLINMRQGPKEALDWTSGLLNRLSRLNRVDIAASIERTRDIMHVVIDGRCIHANMGGIGVAAKHLVEH